MVLKRLTSACLVSGFLISGCATIPPVEVAYHLAETSVQVRVARTVGCSVGNPDTDADDALVVADVVTPLVTHRASSGTGTKIPLNSFASLWSNGDVKVELLPDGRLKTINSTATGQAQPILDAAMKLASSTGIMKSESATGCAAFHTAFKDKTLTITLVSPSITPTASVRGPWELKPDPAAASLHARYQSYFGTLCLVQLPAVADGQGSSAPLTNQPDRDDKRYLHLAARQPAQVMFAVTHSGYNSCGNDQIWSARVPVAQMGAGYTIPIPRPPWFGKQTFAVAFDESGGLATLQYAQESGVASSFSSAQSAYEAGHTTDAERTAALKSEADLIAAQQRLIKCQTAPTSC